MSDQRDGGIAWCDETWNPIRGCSRVSAGCTSCYAERQAARFAGPGQPYHGLAVVTPAGPRWTGEVRLVTERLADPLRWKRQRRIFVNSMSDLFHEKLTNEEIAAVFGVMAAAPQHVFQVLTKRAKRMREWFVWNGEAGVHGCRAVAAEYIGEPDKYPLLYPPLDPRDRSEPTWPLPNVWLGVSAEDQPAADERVPELLACPAAVRWVSYEPALGPIDFRPWLGQLGELGAWTGFGARLDWIVVGGESGPGARPFDVALARSTIAACKAAGVACFVKQFGAKPFAWDAPPNCPQWTEACESHAHALRLRDRKGGDMAEWPAELRVREWPATGVSAAPPPPA